MNVIVDLFQLWFSSKGNKTVALDDISFVNCQASFRPPGKQCVIAKTCPCVLRCDWSIPYEKESAREREKVGWFVGWRMMCVFCVVLDQLCPPTAAPLRRVFVAGPRGLRESWTG